MHDPAWRDAAQMMCSYATIDGYPHRSSRGVPGTPRRSGTAHRVSAAALRRHGRGRPNHVDAAAVQDEHPPARRLDPIAALASTHELSADWLLGLGNVAAGRGGDHRAHVVRSARAHTCRRTPSRMARRSCRLQDPVRPRHASGPVEDRRRHPLRTRGRAAGRTRPRRSRRAPPADMGAPSSAEMECCSSVQGITGFARGEGIWSRLSVASRRREQLEQMIELADALPDVPVVPVRRDAPLRTTRSRSSDRNVRRCTSASCISC